MNTHLVDAYGDLDPVETYLQEDGSEEDVYGDPVPVELWVEDCVPNDAGNCERCGEQVKVTA